MVINVAGVFLHCPLIRRCSSIWFRTSVSKTEDEGSSPYIGAKHFHMRVLIENYLMAAIAVFVTLLTIKLIATEFHVTFNKRSDEESKMD